MHSVFTAFKKNFFCCLLLLSLTATLCYAAPSEYADVLNYLQTHYSPDYEITANVQAVHKTSLLFGKSTKTLERGQELLVLKALDNQPTSLFPPKSVIQISAILEDAIAARVIKEIEAPIKPGDPIILPPPATIYLTGTGGDKDGTDPYDNLLQALLAKNYNVKELAAGTPLPEPETYGLHLSLAVSGQKTTLRIKSLYTNATLYAKTLPKRQPSSPEAPQTPSSPSPESATDITQSSIHTAKQAIPSTESPAPQIRLPREFQRIAAGELDGTPPKELILLNRNEVSAFSWQKDQLTELGTFPFKRDIRLGLHLHTLDLDNNGTDEILATCGKKTSYMDASDTEISSLALDWKGRRFVVCCSDIPFYLRVVQDPEGRNILLGQRKKGANPYAGPIFNVNWDQDSQTLSPGAPYPPASGIHSLYQFLFPAQNRRQVLILEPDHSVSLYKLPNERLLDATDISFGPYREIPYAVRLEEKEYRGGFNEEITSREVFAPRRFLINKAWQNQCFLLKKGRGKQSTQIRITDFFSGKNERDAIVGLQCEAGHIYQSWQSQAIPRDLLDFVFLKDGKRERLIALVRDSQGYALEILAVQTRR